MHFFTMLVAAVAALPFALANTSPEHLFARQTQCPNDALTCGGSCMPDLKHVCCPDEKTACDISTDFCSINIDTRAWSCCPIGQLCAHGGGTSGSQLTPNSSSASGAGPTQSASSSTASGTSSSAASSPSPTSNGADKAVINVMAAAGVVAGIAFW